jgi:cell wall-associated NlpC family hydrolase
MSTLIYSPGVKVYIQTEKKGTLDISDDLTRGTLVRRSDGVSTFQFGLQNARRKYDGVFAPNDRIVVMMKRFSWLRVFTGYLNSVPLVTGWPMEVTFNASCSLKRLQYWFWDPGLSASQTMVANAITAVKKDNDNGDAGVTNAVLTILNSVVGWPEEKVHIAGIPPNWFKFAEKIAKDVDAKAEEADAIAAQFYDILGGAGSVGGASGGIGGLFNGTLKPGKYGNETLNASQLAIIKTIYNAGSQDGMSKHVISAAFCAGRAESDFNATVVNSIGATGLFQMRPSMGWGTSAQCKDPVYASHKWFSVAKGIKSRETMTYGHLAQAVERSGDSSGGIYQRWAPMADALYAALAAGSSAATTPNTNPGNVGQAVGAAVASAVGAATGKATGLKLVQTALNLIKVNPHIPYREGGDSPPSTKPQNVRYLDCSSFTQWVYYQTLGSLHGFPRTADVQAGYCGAHGKILTPGSAMKIRGALMFWDNNGKAYATKSGFGHASHVEMSIGDGTHTVGSHHSGTYASVVNTKGFWHIGGLLPNIDYSADGGGVGVDFGGSGDDAAGATGGVQLSTGAQQPWYNPNDEFDKMFGNNPWVPQYNVDSAESEALVGIRALLNDQPLLPYIKNLMNSTMRSFSSAPNGDLIAWFPDYYGIWGTSASMVIEPIELQDFYVEWSDDFFVTHQFTVAPRGQQGLDLLSGEVNPNSPLQAVTTLGIATIDIPSIMYALFGLEPSADAAQKFIAYIYKRFGARPDFQQMPGVTGPRGEFFSAIFLFMRQWAYQYNADVPITFMPELWPGMNIKVPAFDFQAYVTTVTHNFQFGDNPSFTTTANIAAPARLSQKGSGNLIGLPIAGGLGNTDAAVGGK